MVHKPPFVEQANRNGLVNVELDVNKSPWMTCECWQYADSARPEDGHLRECHHTLLAKLLMKRRLNELNSLEDQHVAGIDETSYKRCRKTANQEHAAFKLHRSATSVTIDEEDYNKSWLSTPLTPGLFSGVGSCPTLKKRHPNTKQISLVARTVTAVSSILLPNHNEFVHDLRDQLGVVYTCHDFVRDRITFKCSRNGCKNKKTIPELHAPSGMKFCKHIAPVWELSKQEFSGSNFTYGNCSSLVKPAFVPHNVQTGAVFQKSRDDDMNVLEAILVRRLACPNVLGC